jgi:hypothetical protein
VAGFSEDLVQLGADGLQGNGRGDDAGPAFATTLMITVILYPILRSWAFRPQAVVAR